MNPAQKSKTALLVAIDIAIMYLGLYLALRLRYFGDYKTRIWDIHQMPFVFIHAAWLLVFYINGLYDAKTFASYKKIFSNIVKSMATATVIAVAIFYLIPKVVIVTPKTNLIIDAAIVTIFLLAWRRIYWSFEGKSSKTKILFIGSSAEITEIDRKIKSNPLLGYESAGIITDAENGLVEKIKTNGIQIIAVSKKMMSNEKIAKKLYQTIPLGANIVDFESFYESIVEKVPVYLINETWFLENIRDINKKNIDILKRIFDIIFSVILGIPTLLLAPLIFLLSKIESNDRLIVRQERVGKNGKIFMLLKFRSMYSATEKDGKAKWADKNDSRITKFGNIIRKTRIDELPQVWNIFKGEMSFVGPRPERPEFVSQLEKQIPHYAMRHLVKPGLSGWAQIKFSYGASVEDAMEKLQHDLYYIKNRSLVLELAIAVKTIKTILAREGR